MTLRRPSKLPSSSLGDLSGRVVVLKTMKLHLSKFATGVTFLGLLAIAGCSKVSEAATTDAPAASKADAPPSAKAQASTAESANFSVRLTVEEPCKKGTTCTALVTVDAKGGYHINDKYPYRFKLTEPPAPGVTYPKPVVDREDGTFSETKAVLRVPFVAENAGEAKVGGTLSFSVCSDEKCLIDKQALETVAKVE